LTAVSTVGGGYLTLYPSGSSIPTVATLNWTDWRQAGTNIARDVGNLAIVPIGADGQISMVAGTNAATSGAEVVVDVVGYIDVAGQGNDGYYYGLGGGVRLYDSRATNNPGNSVSGVLAAGEQRVLQARGLGGIPASAKKLVVRLTTVDASGGGFLALYSGGSWPGNSSVNLNGAGQQIGNLAIVSLAADGSFVIYNGSGANQIGVVLDIIGFL
jgi:hypothetical protein